MHTAHRATGTGSTGRPLASAIIAATIARIERTHLSLASLPRTAARMTVGWIFVQSGWGKLHHLESVVKFFTDLGVPAPQLQAPFVAGIEFLGGSLLLLGLGTRFAALPLIGVMTVALSTALRDQVGSLSDLFGLAEFGYVVLLAGLAILGAGPLS